MSRFLLLLTLVAPALACAAPDEALLSEPKSLVDVWSRMDELHAARGVQKSAAPRPFKRAGAAFGIHGQAIFVDPASKLVVVHTAAWAAPNDRDARRAQFQLWSRLLTVLSSS